MTRLFLYLLSSILIASICFIYAATGRAQYERPSYSWPSYYSLIIPPQSIILPSPVFYPFYTFTGFRPPFLAWPHLTLTNQPRAEAALTAAIIPIITPVYTYSVINVYPHDRSAFTEGLVFDNGFLYEGTGGDSSLRKVDLVTGHILQYRELPDPYWGEGVTVYGNRIIQLTWLNNTGFVYDKYSFDLLQQFSYPTEGWGLTHNGKNLIMSDGTATLHFLDPKTFAETGSIEVYDQDGPVNRLNELEYIKGEIYANVWLTDRIARISPVTGQVLGWIDLSGLLNTLEVAYPVDVLNGIAYDEPNDRLFVTGKFWPALFEIDLIPVN